MNTLGATGPGLKLPPENTGSRVLDPEAAEGTPGVFSAVLGALKGSAGPGRGIPSEREPASKAREDAAAEAAPSLQDAPMNPLAFLAAVIPAGPYGATPPSPRDSLETLVARAVPIAVVRAAAPAGEPMVAEPSPAEPLPAGSMPGLADEPAAMAEPAPPPAAADPRTRVTVLSRETHFAPVLPRLPGAAAPSIPQAGASSPGPAPSPSAIEAGPGIPVRGLAAPASGIDGASAGRSGEAEAEAPRFPGPPGRDAPVAAGWPRPSPPFPSFGMGAAGVPPEPANSGAPIAVPDAVAFPSAAPPPGSQIAAASSIASPTDPASGSPRNAAPPRADGAGSGEDQAGLPVMPATARPEEDAPRMTGGRISAEPVVSTRGEAARPPGTSAHPAQAVPSLPGEPGAGTPPLAVLSASAPVGPAVSALRGDTGAPPRPGAVPPSEDAGAATPEPGSGERVAHAQAPSPVPAAARPGPQPGADHLDPNAASRDRDVAAPAPGDAPDPVQPGATVPGLTAPGTATQGLPSAPVTQIAEAVLGQLPRGLAGLTPDSSRVDGPLRLLTLQLHPADLGTVIVRMRLRDGQLEMSLHAGSEETARLLREGGDVLDGLLRQGGYQPERITILAAAPPGPSSAEGAAVPSRTETGANPDQAAQDQASQDQPGRRHSDGQPAAPSDSHERTHDNLTRSPDRSGIYL